MKVRIRRHSLFDGRIRTYTCGQRVAVANRGPLILFQHIGSEDKVAIGHRDWGPEAA